MAIDRLLTDLNYHQSLPNQPKSEEGYTPEVLKALFDKAPNDIKDYINNVLIPALESTADGESGADQIGATAISDLSGTTVQAILESLRNKLKSTEDGASGADFINATAISGLSGTTVQSLLEALKTHIDTNITNNVNALAAHKTSADHDGRYYTETEVNSLINTHKTSADHDNRYYTKTDMQSTTTGNSGASKIKISAVSEITSDNVQGAIEQTNARITQAVLGQVPDGSLTDAKLSNAAGQIKDRVTKIEAQISEPVYVEQEETAEIFSLATEGQISDVQVMGNTVNQIIQNGNFADGLSGWQSSLSVLSVVNNTLIVTGNGTGLYPQANYYTIIPAGRRYFVRLYARLTVAYTNAAYIALQVAGTTGVKAKIINNPVVNQWYEVSDIFDTSTFTGNLKFIIYHQYADAATTNGKIMEVKEVMAIDMGSSASDNPLYNLTVDEMRQRFPNWLQYGVVSTLPVSVTATKNVFNKNEKPTYANVTYSTTSTGIKITTSVGTFRYACWDFILEPNTQYKIQRNLNIISGCSNTNDAKIRVFDAITNAEICYIAKTEANDTQKSFISPSHGNIRVYLYAIFDVSGSGEVEFNNLQITKGDATYEQYGAGGEAYIPAEITLRSLPNGVKDVFSIIDGVYTKNISDDIQIPTSGWAVDSSLTNTYRAILSNFVSQLPIVNGISQVLMLGSNNWTFLYDYTSDTEHFYVHPTLGHLYIFVNKATIDAQAGSTLADKFSVWLSSFSTRTLIYQLASPITKYYFPQNLSGKTIIIKKRFAYFGFYDAMYGLINLTDIPIKSLHKVLLVDKKTGAETEIDLSTCTVAADGMSFTSSALRDGDLVWYVANYDSTTSTIPTTKVTIANNIKAMVETTAQDVINLSKRVNRLKQERNIIISTESPTAADGQDGDIWLRYE